MGRAVARLSQQGRGGKNHKGGHIFNYNVGCCAATATKKVAFDI